MATSYRTLFSKADAYHFADSIMDMYSRFKIIRDFAVAKDDKETADLYGSIMLQFDFLIEGYGLKEMLKIE